MWHYGLWSKSCILYHSAIVSFGKVTPEQKEEVEKFGLAIYSWEEFLQLVGYVNSYIIFSLFSCSVK